MMFIKVKVFLSLLFIFAFGSCRNTLHKADYRGWPNYAGSKDGVRYSSNKQINVSNVARLKEVWRYSSNDKDPRNRSQNQCNPIVIDGVFYGTSPQLKLLALDAATGKEKWIFNPATEDTIAAKDPSAFFKVSRGVTWWQSSDGKEQTIFYSVGERLYAINAADGKPRRAFGKNGYILLSENLDREAGFNPFVAGTTPGIIFKDLLITGMRLAESQDAAPGHIRAFDVRTGARRWIFHTIPYPGEKGYETWPDKDAWKKTGGANNWAGMCLDEKRGIVYVPTGSIAGDFYGALRKGENLYANSLIALDAASGKYIWHYQVVHHDLWDRDLPANPNLVTIKKNGKRIDAVAQVTKHGYVFLFDRVTGEPLYPVTETPVPQHALPGEAPWPTQPVPASEPFARQQFRVEDVSDVFPDRKAELLEKYKAVKYDTAFTPPSKEGSWIFPGFDGGGEWGGAAVDPQTATLYINSTELPWSLTMIDKPARNTNDRSPFAAGRTAYNNYCLSCHGAKLEGNGSAYPSLLNLSKKYNAVQLRSIIDNGRNMMPSFRHISETDKQAMINFLLNINTADAARGNEATAGKELPREPGGAEADNLPSAKSLADQVPYVSTGYIRFLDKNGYPGIKPPWGTLNAFDLNTGKLKWKVPLGEYPELSARGIPPTGTENYGGPVVTKGGLVFIAATKDAKIRAFDKKTGKVLWEADLPVPGYATPSTYMVDARQYLVVACGGGKIGSKSGDEYIAFALP